MNGKKMTKRERARILRIARAACNSGWHRIARALYGRLGYSYITADELAAAGILGN